MYRMWSCSWHIEPWPDPFLSRDTHMGGKPALGWSKPRLTNHVCLAPYNRYKHVCSIMFIMSDADDYISLQSCIHGANLSFTNPYSLFCSNRRDWCNYTTRANPVFSQTISFLFKFVFEEINTALRATSWSRWQDTSVICMTVSLDFRQERSGTRCDWDTSQLG